MSESEESLGVHPGMTELRGSRRREGDEIVGYWLGSPAVAETMRERIGLTTCPWCGGHLGGPVSVAVSDEAIPGFSLLTARYALSAGSCLAGHVAHDAQRQVALEEAAGPVAEYSVTFDGTPCPEAEHIPLLPCPACGGAAVDGGCDCLGHQRPHKWCWGCRMCGPEAASAEAAAAAWNALPRRGPRPPMMITLANGGHLSVDPPALADGVSRWRLTAEPSPPQPLAAVLTEQANAGMRAAAEAVPSADVSGDRASGAEPRPSIRVIIGPATVCDVCALHDAILAAYPDADVSVARWPRPVDVVDGPGDWETIITPSCDTREAPDPRRRIVDALVQLAIYHPEALPAPGRSSPVVLTLDPRTYLAGQALAGLMESGSDIPWEVDDVQRRMIGGVAATAVRLADALLAELDKAKGSEP